MKTTFPEISLHSIPAAIAEELVKAAPSIAFTVSREQDCYFSWDGDGPDPRDDGFSPYNVEVSAAAIVSGEIVTGETGLGGCYFRPDEPTGEIHGYLLQMLNDAVNDLCAALARRGAYDGVLLTETATARAYIRGAMKAAYDKQRAEMV